jgi:hypothetical protein
MQSFGHLSRREHGLFDIVECAGVQQPNATQVFFSTAWNLFEIAIQPVEQHRIADPHDPSNHVHPAHN